MKKKIEIEVPESLCDQIVVAQLKDWADMNVEEVIDLLDELNDNYLEQYKLKDLNDSVRTLKALLVVIKYCTVSPSLDYHEEVVAEYEDAIFS